MTTPSTKTKPSAKAQPSATVSRGEPFEISHRQWVQGDSGPESGVSVDERSAFRKITIAATPQFKITHRASSIIVYAGADLLPDRVTIGPKGGKGVDNTHEWVKIGTLGDATVIDPIQAADPLTLDQIQRILELEGSKDQSHIDERKSLLASLTRVKWTDDIVIEIKAGFFAGREMNPTGVDVGPAAPTTDVKVPIRLEFEYEPLKPAPTKRVFDDNQNVKFDITD